MSVNGARRANVVAISVAVVLIVACVFVFIPSPLGFITAALVSIIGGTMCLHAWKKDALLAIESYTDLAGTALAAFVIIGLFFVADCAVSKVNPLDPGGWARLVERSGPVGFVLTVGSAAVAMFFVVASAVRIGLLASKSRK